VSTIPLLGGEALSEDSPAPNSSPDVINSGPEIVAQFVEEMRSDSNLDKATIEAVAKLYRDGTLTRTSLLKLLEQERG
jgi:hypothetical protein